MQVRLLDKVLSDIDAEISIAFLTKEALEGHPHKALLVKAGFKAEQEQTCALHEKALLVCGVEKYESEYLRSAASTAAGQLLGFGYTSAKTMQYLLKNAEAIVEGFILGGYRFDAYRSKPEKRTFKTLYLASEGFDGETVSFTELDRAVDNATIIAQATNFTRELVNTTPDDMTPQVLSIVAKDLADENDLGCVILDEHGLEEEKMNAMLSVGRASIHGPRLIHLSHKPKHPKAVVTLVGKGLTYDSGGLSLKPATSMVTMKLDKAGACAVLGILKAVSQLRLPIEVHGLIGAAENMVDGNAYKPDDVLTARNGKTIEVRNTDAEGRLVLADVLSYAQDKVKADYLFDFATLTGASMVALGPFTSGVMGHDAQLKEQFQKATEQSGELIGTLPFNRHLKKLIKSEVADISNIGSRPYGGAITAALFLDEFITDAMKKRWLHFDIAGPAYTETPWDCNPHGGTGAGVRMGIRFLQSLDT